MSMPVEARKNEAGPPSQPLVDRRQSVLALVYELTEPLTAIQNYLDAAGCLHYADTTAASARLSEVFEKTQIESTRASEILHRLRDLLQHEEGTGKL